MKKKPKERTLPTALIPTPSSKVDTSTTDSPSKWIRIERPFPLPSYVKDALYRLSNAGHLAYLVGGSVRDFLLGHEVKDHDIATSAHPNELCQLFPNAIEVGKAFGVIKVPTGTYPPLLEIATFRQDLDYQDFRRPKGVVFSGPAQDALRRDFTINALFFDPKTSRILDFTSGVEDLKNKKIRAIGSPSERLKEDALRLLRAVRFKTRLGFQIEAKTAEAIRLRAKLITKVSAERIRDELTLMWRGPNPGVALEMLSEFGLLGLLLPELEALRGVPQIPSSHRHETLWDHELRMLRVLAEQTPERSQALAWAAILHDVGKPEALRLTHGKNFNGHEQESVKLIRKITERLRMSRADSELISDLVEELTQFKEVFQMRESTLQRFIRRPYFEELLALYKADAVATDGNLAFYEFAFSRFEAFRQTPHLQSPKLIDGHDLLQLGFQPGPEFSEILRVLEDLVFEKKISTKEEALDYVISHWAK
ncbi:MAG: CCA tRNA nucleotidyltransferase [Bdellovibrionia bacterium]